MDEDDRNIRLAHGDHVSGVHPVSGDGAGIPIDSETATARNARQRVRMEDFTTEVSTALGLQD